MRGGAETCLVDAPLAATKLLKPDVLISVLFVHCHCDFVIYYFA